MIEIQWADEQFGLLPQRAVWWPRRRTLLVADLHLGKPAAFRYAGVPVPDGSLYADLERLDTLIHRHQPERLVLLGDLLHARTGRSPETLDALGAWSNAHRSLELLLIRGNHDARAGDPPDALGFRVLDEPSADPDDGDIRFTHYPDCDTDDHPALCGHVHPGVVMFNAVATHRAPCFWVRPDRLVLPAFGSFTGVGTIAPGPDDRVFAIGRGEIAQVRTVRPLRKAAAR